MKKVITSSLPPIDVLIVDDHTLLREGLKTMLGSFKQQLLLNVWEAPNGEMALHMASAHFFPLVFADYRLNGMMGDEFTRRLLRFQQNSKVLALSNYDDINCVHAMMEAGAMGYVLKSIDAHQLLLAIETVLQGKKYYCNEIALTLLAESQFKTSIAKAVKYHLTEREIEILYMITQGMRNEHIAQTLFIAKRTVDTHRQNLMKKLDVHNTAGLVRFALELGS